MLQLGVAERDGVSAGGGRDAIDDARDYCVLVPSERCSVTIRRHLARDETASDISTRMLWIIERQS